MTDLAKLQQLFEAALKAPPIDYSVNPAKLRSVPNPPSAAARIASIVPAPAPVDEAPVANPDAAVENPAVRVEPSHGLSRKESEALDILTDAQALLRKRMHRMEALVTALVLFSMTAGALGWFVSDPDRVQAFQKAVGEMRSVGDIKSLITSYQNSLDRIPTRSN